MHGMENFKIKRQLVTHRHYSSIANSQTKLLATFRGIFVFLFAVFRNSCVFIRVFSRGTPNDVLWNPGWETLFYTFPSRRCLFHGSQFSTSLFSVYYSHWKHVIIFKYYLCKQRTQDGVLWLDYRLENPRNGGSIPGKGKRIFSSSERPHRLWGPPSWHRK